MTKDEIKRKGSQRFYEIMEENEDLHERKNQNYATEEDPLSNLRASEAFGIPAWIGTLIRITDKYSRIVELAKGRPDLVGESIKDTLRDLSIYSVLCLVLYEEWEKTHGDGNTTTPFTTDRKQQGDALLQPAAGKKDVSKRHTKA